jgi:hypothetical protein
MAVQDALQKTKNEKPKKPAKKQAVVFNIDRLGALQ